MTKWRMKLLFLFSKEKLEIAKNIVFWNSDRNKTHVLFCFVFFCCLFKKQMNFWKVMESDSKWKIVTFNRTDLKWKKNLVTKNCSVFLFFFSLFMKINSSLKQCKICEIVFFLNRKKKAKLQTEEINPHNLDLWQLHH